MSKILEICTMMISITETLMHSNWQLSESRYLTKVGNEELAYDLQDNVSDQLRECLDKIGEVLHSYQELYPYDEDDDYDEDDEDDEESSEQEDFSAFHPDLSPDTNAEFRRMLDLTDSAISREHMSRLSANTGKPDHAALMHEQADKLWHEAFLSMCKYVAMCHSNTIANILREQ